MFARIPGLLEPGEARSLAERLAVARFIDGRQTASGAAARVKNNLQLAPDAEGAEDMRRVVLEALFRSERFRQFALPKIVVPPVFNRYEVGMEYGQHVDAPTTRGGEQMRVDVSLTIFLSDPASYEGGEFVIETLSGGIGIKGALGEGVVYPSTTLHRVAPVKSGVRLAAITWVRSVVRDAGQREILCELDLAIKSLESRAEGGRAELDLLRKTHHNLVRMWAD
jgi:PKHD-type hydroxylase